MLMRNNFEIINKIYKPYRYTIKGKTLLLSCTDNNNVALKEKNKDKNIGDIYNYLSSRGFNNYVRLVDNNRSKYNVYEYVINNDIPYEQRAKDLIKLVALMHAKTSYTKEIDKNIYEDIYTNIDSNISYLKEYYSKMYDDIFLKEIFSPYENIFMDNYSLINNALNFSKNELDKWYSVITDNKFERLCLIHNNLKVDHLIKGCDDYLISFDNAKIDTPVLDLYVLYKNEYNKVNFKELLDTYNYYSELKDYELKFFFILISIPNKFILDKDNFVNLKNMFNIVNYINKTEDLIRPYYANNDEEE